MIGELSPQMVQWWIDISYPLPGLGVLADLQLAEPEHPALQHFSCSEAERWDLANLPEKETLSNSHNGRYPQILVY